MLQLTFKRLFYNTHIKIIAGKYLPTPIEKFKDFRARNQVRLTIRIWASKFYISICDFGILTITSIYSYLTLYAEVNY